MGNMYIYIRNEIIRFVISLRIFCKIITNLTDKTETSIQKIIPYDVTK